MIQQNDFLVMWEMIFVKFQKLWQNNVFQQVGKYWIIEREGKGSEIKIINELVNK